MKVKSTKQPKAESDRSEIKLKRSGSRVRFAQLRADTGGDDGEKLEELEG
jgi:hypothetical protein